MTTDVPLAFVAFTAVAPGRPELEVGAIRVDPNTLAWRSVFTGCEPSPCDSSDAPRSMPRAQLAAGVAAIVQHARVVAWHPSVLDEAISRLLAAGGRTERIAGLVDLAAMAAPHLEAADVDPTDVGDVLSWVTNEAPPRRALAIAAAMAQLYGRIRAAARTAAHIGAVDGDEGRIADVMLARLRNGRPTYGPWRLTDGRNLRREAMEEAIDGLHYSFAQLLRASRRRQVVYVATGLPPNHASVTAAVRDIIARRGLPLLPWQVAPLLQKDGASALDATRMLIETADSVLLVGGPPPDFDVIGAIADALDVPVFADCPDCKVAS